MPVIDEELLAKLSAVQLEPVVREASEGEEKAFAKIQRLISVRERCESELRARLLRDGFASEDAESALRRAVSCGLVDDLRYAGVLIRSRIAQGRGRSGIVAELERVGIDASLVPGWPDEYFPEDAPSEIERALELLRRKPSRSKDVRGAAFRRLMGKGYSQQVAYDAARRYAEEVSGFGSSPRSTYF